MEEETDHINVLELRAILFGQSLCENVSGHVRIMTDNTTALAYVNHHRGVKSPECNLVDLQIWDWAEQKGVWLSAAHIQGVENVLADFKSRVFADNLEWSLSHNIFGKIVAIFGLPEIDLFASRLNSQNQRLMLLTAWKASPCQIPVIPKTLKMGVVPACMVLTMKERPRNITGRPGISIM